MKKLSLLLFIITFLSSAFIVADEWEYFTLKDIGCKVKFPSKPQGNTQAVPTEAGNIEIKHYMVETDDYALIVAVNEYPKSVINEDSSDEKIEQSLMGGVQGAANSMQGTVEYTRNITIGKYKGKEAKISFEGGKATNRIRMYAVGSKLYQLQVLGYDSQKLTQMSDTFFNSFKLL